MLVLRKVGVVVLAATFGACAGEQPAVEDAVEQTAAAVGVLDANLATEAEMQTVPHIDAELATKIVSARTFMTALAFNGLLAESLSAEQIAQVLPRLFVPVNLNTASNEELHLVPGSGDRMVHEFEEYRPYTSIEQFRREMGKYVDEAEVARFEQYVFVPIDLNTATREEMLMIPGVGDRIAHEFEEYRPYQSIEQFRREIGKYVDTNEVARLERYVEIR